MSVLIIQRDFFILQLNCNFDKKKDFLIFFYEVYGRLRRFVTKLAHRATPGYALPRSIRYANVPPSVSLPQLAFEKKPGSFWQPGLSHA